MRPCKIAEATFFVPMIRFTQFFFFLLLSSFFAQNSVRAESLRKIDQQAAVSAFAFSPDGKTLASSSFDHTVQISALP
ncbi:MAG: hypothetical protein H7Y37_06135 [Anaerolineae bacterium]|nr:hypothetical protein [Gloeobacterales cyanobacterium ES-bin-313]